MNEIIHEVNGILSKESFEWRIQQTPKEFHCDESTKQLRNEICTKCNNKELFMGHYKCGGECFINILVAIKDYECPLDKW